MSDNRIIEESILLDGNNNSLFRKLKVWNLKWIYVGAWGTIIPLKSIVYRICGAAVRQTNQYHSLPSPLNFSEINF